MPDLCVAGRSAAGGLRCLIVFAYCAALAGCTASSLTPAVSAPASHAPPALAPPALAPPAIAPAEPPAATAPAEVPSQPAGLRDIAAAVLAYADRVRSLQAPELNQEIARLGDPGDSAQRQMQLAVALGLSRTPANTVRAQALLQRVLAQNQPENQALHPLARLLTAQFADLRRAEEQIERQGQQLRDSQRRIDQLTERLEAVRAIERSLRSPAAPAASAPANGQRP